MPIKATRPKLFRDKSYKNVGKRTVDAMRSDILDRLQATALQVDNVSVKRMPTYLQITEQKLEKKGVIDLKKAFARSSKKKRAKDGGWYLTVPIRIKTSKMNNKTYQDLRSLKIGSSSNSVSTLTDYLEGRRNNISHPSLKVPSSNGRITKVRNGKKSSYFMFRTVSSKSPASSWILNRDKVNENNFSKTTLKYVRNLMNWKIKNLM
ncbi:phage protein [Staphylococcus phage MR003]|nr:phage protein [Staphylococcus phage MR003]